MAELPVIFFKKLRTIGPHLRETLSLRTVLLQLVTYSIPAFL